MNASERLVREHHSEHEHVHEHTFTNRSRTSEHEHVHEHVHEQPEHMPNKLSANTWAHWARDPGPGPKKSAGPGPLALFFGLGPGSRAQCVQVTYFIMSKTEMVFYGVKQKLVHLLYIVYIYGHFSFVSLQGNRLKPLRNP